MQPRKELRELFVKIKKTAFDGDEQGALALIDAGIKQYGEAVFFTEKNDRDLTIFEDSCYSGKPNVVKHLLTYPASYANADILDVLDGVRDLSFFETDLHLQHHDTCLLLRGLIPQSRNLPAPPISQAQPSVFDLEQKRENLLRHFYPIRAGVETHHAKKTALRLANAQLAAMLQFPAACNKYLRFLNDEFKRYHLHKHGTNVPQPNAEHYDIQTLFQLRLPIPKATYASEKKHGSLQEYLILFLRRHGVARNAIKWLDFIPKRVASTMVGDGEFVMEAYGSGLFHSKLAHMFQSAILACMIDNGDISLDYIDKNRIVRRLTFQEILQSQLSTGILADKRNPDFWSGARDISNEKTAILCDPLRIQSYLTCYADEIGAPELSWYLIDSFCKDYLKLYGLFAANILTLGSLEDFTDQLSDVALYSFHSYEFIMNHLTATYKAKPNFTQIIPTLTDKPFLAFTKTLNCAADFIPAAYKETAQEAELKKRKK